MNKLGEFGYQIGKLKQRRPKIFWLGIISSSITISREVINTIEFVIDLLL
ncbi:MAG: hypothetical protein Q8Q18_00765 [bacterium]|nr:hypothetical protein [bacterium]